MATIKVRFWWLNYSPEEAFDPCTLNNPEGLQVDVGHGLRRPMNGKGLWDIDAWLSDQGYVRGMPREIENSANTHLDHWQALYEFEYKAPVVAAT